MQLYTFFSKIPCTKKPFPIKYVSSPDEHFHFLQIFEFLLAFCGLSDLRVILYRVFELNQQSSDGNEQDDAFTGVLFWMNKNTDTHLVSIKALEFFKEIYEVYSVHALNFWVFLQHQYCVNHGSSEVNISTILCQ